jgi:hypothetical protein
MRNLILAILAFGLFSCTKPSEPDGFIHYREATPAERSALDAYYHFTIKGVRYDISRPGMLYQAQHMIVHTPPHSMQTIYGKLTHNGSSITFTPQHGKPLTFKLP